MMTDKEIREYLSSYKLLRLRAKFRYERIDFFRKYNTAGEHCEMLAREAEELIAEGRKIESAIDSLAEPSRTILRLRYIEDYTLEETADRLYYSCRWTSQLQAKAIDDFRKAVKE